MSPDEKYMLPNFNNTSGDINFRPLLDELGLKNLTMGWIPVFFPSGSMATMTNGSFPGTMTTPQTPQEYTEPQPTTSGMNSTTMPSQQYQQYQTPLPMSGFSNVDQSNSNMMQALRDFDLDLDEDEDLSRVPPNRVDQIFREIERNNPGAFSLFQAYKIPPPIIKLIVRRIIRLTLYYCK